MFSWCTLMTPTMMMTIVQEAEWEAWYWWGWLLKKYNEREFIFLLPFILGPNETNNHLFTTSIPLQSLVSWGGLLGGHTMSFHWSHFFSILQEFGERGFLSCLRHSHACFLSETCSYFCLTSSLHIAVSIWRWGKKRFLHRICDPQIFQVNVAFDDQWEQENRFCSLLKKLDRGTA